MKNKFSENKRNLYIGYGVFFLLCIILGYFVQSTILNKDTELDVSTRQSTSRTVKSHSSSSKSIKSSSNKAKELSDAELSKKLNNFVKDYLKAQDNSVNSHTDKISQYFISKDNATYQTAMKDINDMSYSSFETTPTDISITNHDGNKITLANNFTRILKFSNNQEKQSVSYGRIWYIFEQNNKYYIDSYETSLPLATPMTEQLFKIDELKDGNYSSAVGVWKNDKNYFITFKDDGLVDDISSTDETHQLTNIHDTGLWQFSGDYFDYTYIFDSAKQSIIIKYGDTYEEYKRIDNDPNFTTPKSEINLDEIMSGNYSSIFGKWELPNGKESFTVTLNSYFPGSLFTGHFFPTTINNGVLEGNGTTKAQAGRSSFVYIVPKNVKITQKLANYIPLTDTVDRIIMKYPYDEQYNIYYREGEKSSYINSPIQ